MDDVASPAQTGAQAGLTPRAPRLFVSYAYDSERHIEDVRSFWVLLRSQGIDARLDLPATARRQDWPVWMLRQVRDSDFVLVIASPAYRRRAEGDAGADEGRGVQFEAALIREELYRDRDTGTAKFLPVLLPGASTDDIPAFLGPTSATSYEVRELTAAGIESLLRVITAQPWEVEIPLGTIPLLPARGSAVAAAPRAAATIAHELVLEVACEQGRVRCRAALSGSLLGERESALPAILGSVWSSLARPSATAEARLADAGQQLRAALLDDAWVGNVVELLDRSPMGTVLDVVLVADGAALELPYELMRLPDGRLLATVPGVRVLRRLPGLARDATPPLAGPLKLLVAVGAPRETRTRNAPLDVEREMQAILDAVSPLDESAGAQVTILEVAGPRQISEALRRDQYHVLHLSAHGSQSALELEDEDGDPVSVEASELVRGLRLAGRPLPLTVLSSCAGAAGGSHGLAATLVRHGIDRVVAMQTTVTDQYATALAREFYETLARGQVTAAGALGDARRTLEDERRAAERSTGAPWLAEDAVPTLLAAGVDLPLVDPSAPAERLTSAMVVPSGGGVRRLPIGYLIGRREQLRIATAALRGGDGAVERFGAISGVLLTGVGGIGKTALAGRLETRLAGDGWLTAVHEGRWNPSALTAAVAGALAPDPSAEADAGLADARARLTSAEVDDATKLDCVCRLLSERRLLLIFDDFEQNLDVAQTKITYKDPGFAEVFETLCAAAETGRLLVTTRYPPPGARAFLLEVAIPPLSHTELRRMLLRLPALRDLDAADRRALVGTIGGHPRLLEFVNALLRGGRGNLREVTVKLRALAGDSELRPSEATVERVLREAVLLGARDVLLDELIGLLDDGQREVLLQAAVSTLPLTLDDLAIACWGTEVTQEQRTSVVAASERLRDLTLLSPADDEQVVVHPWIGQALLKHQGDHFAARHEQAAAMRLTRVQSGSGDFADLVEICRHFAAAQHVDDLIGFAFAAIDAVGSRFGELSVAAFLGEIVPMVPPDAEGFLPLADRESEALVNTGSVSAALQRAQAVMDNARRRAQSAPDDAIAQYDLSVAHNRLGDLMLRVGDGAQAERHFRESMTIRGRLAQADPADAAAQRALAISYQRMGDLERQLGDGREAERYYRDALAIVERLAAADPDNADGQRDLSVFYNRLGDLMRQLGNGREAQRYYRDDLAIAERLAQAAPDNASLQRDVAVSYQRMGDLMAQLGDGVQAERYYAAELAITEPLVRLDPSNANAQRDVSVSYNKLGDLLVARGDSAQAEHLYRAALDVRERLAQADLSNATAQRDLSASYARLGDLMRRVGDGAQAERFYRDALAINERLVQADPTNANVQRDLSVSYQRVGDLMRELGDGASAEHFYREDLAIAVRLAEADPSNAGAQRDLASSDNKLGDLVAALGDTAQAERLYRDALAIVQRLSEADPDNVDAQRDLSVSYNRLGDLMRQLGDGAQAERFYRDDLQISERVAQADPGNVNSQRDLAVSYERLGDLTHRLGDDVEAERLHRGALSVRQRLAEADPDDAGRQRDLSVSYSRLGDLMFELGDAEQAERFYREDLSIAQKLATADPANSAAQGDLAVSYGNLGVLMRRRGDGAQAERFHRDNLEVRERLAAAQPDDPAAQRDLSVSCSRLGDLMLELGDLPEAERWYREDLAIAQRLAAAEPSSPQLARDLALSYAKLAELMRRREDAAQAEALYREALALREPLARSEQGGPLDQRDLSVTYSRLGDLAGERGDLPEVERMYRADLEIAERLAAGDPADATLQRDLAISRGKLGDLMFATDRDKEGADLLRSALTLLEPLLAHDDPWLEGLRARLASLGGEQMPAGGEQTPAGGEQTPAGGEQTPAGGERTSAGGEQT